MKFEGVDPAVVAEIEEGARAMQAEIVAKGARWVGRKIRRIVAPALTALRCWSCRRRTLATPLESGSKPVERSRLRRVPQAAWPVSGTRCCRSQ